MSRYIKILSGIAIFASVTIAHAAMVVGSFEGTINGAMGSAYGVGARQGSCRLGHAANG